MEATTENLSYAGKVVSVAAGEAHTLVLTENKRVYSWGRGMFGRLGTGLEADQLSPVEVNFGNSQINLVGIAAGAYHSLALQDDGSLWSWGYNVFGQLGNDGDNSATPCLVTDFVDESSTTEIESPLKISRVEAGGMMSAAIDNQGSLWVWGYCPQQSGKDGGEFGFTSSFAPAIFRPFTNRTVARVACGNEHAVALVQNASGSGGALAIFSWGGNKHGQLGLGDTESRASPETVDLESPWEAYEVACGGFHTAVLARENGENGISSCWTFGLGENGQLGLGTTQSSGAPRRVSSLPSSAGLVSVGCGLFHTSVVSASGEVWSWGMERGLGLCPDARVGSESGDAISPISIVPSDATKFDRPVQIACGAAHTVLVACGGRKLWSWGRGRSGVLGTGKLNDFLAPAQVQWPEEEAEEVVEAKIDGDDVIVAEKGLEASDDGGETGLEDLRAKLEAVERYAGVLHRAIFGRALEERDVSGSGHIDVAKEWDKMLERAGRAELVGLEMFYRSMLSGVKDQLMKRRIRETIKECLGSLAKGTLRDD